MLASLPKNAQEITGWSWSQFEPYFQELASRALNAENILSWLTDWSRLVELVNETQIRLYVGTTRDTTDQEIQQQYNAFLDDVFPEATAAGQRLKEKLLASGLEPEGFDIALRNMRAEADLFREDNLPLMAEEQKLSTKYNEVIGAMTVEWEGEELTLMQLQPIFQEPDREKRERAWRLSIERQTQDREAINDLWAQFMKLRREQADNADMPDYRAFRWRYFRRFDYSPDDCLSFHRAIEEVVVPAAQRIYEKRRQQLGVESLRPWDLQVDPLGRPPLRPYQTIEELEVKSSAIFHKVDSELGGYFEQMRQGDLLDLDNRKGKAPGGYCSEYPAARLPFIFMNAVGIHDDVQTMLHEGGHAFHVFETQHLPYFQQRYEENIPIEFAEVASMAMELIAAPYLSEREGGFYSEADAARARIEHLEGIIQFWPYMAVVDAFQHWVYTYPEEGSNPDTCDAKWAELWGRFMKGVDWSGLEDGIKARWRRQLHISTAPFYYVEYGLAQLGAVQVWRNSLRDQAGAVADYRKALALGATATLPELFATAGAKFAFDADTMRDAVNLIEKKIEELETVS